MRFQLKQHGVGKEAILGRLQGGRSNDLNVDTHPVHAQATVFDAPFSCALAAEELPSDCFIETIRRRADQQLVVLTTCEIKTNK